MKQKYITIGTTRGKIHDTLHSPQTFAEKKTTKASPLLSRNNAGRTSPQPLVEPRQTNIYMQKGPKMHLRNRSFCLLTSHPDSNKDAIPLPSCHTTRLHQFLLRSCRSMHTWSGVCSDHRVGSRALRTDTHRARERAIVSLSLSHNRTLARTRFSSAVSSLVRCTRLPVDHDTVCLLVSATQRPVTCGQ